ncbi:DNA polymerase V subunit UmuC [compost metagenome]
MFALVDVNSFYTSCETVFRPHLQGKPVDVVSNNDGCIISRSEDYVELKVKLAKGILIVGRDCLYELHISF